MADIDELLNKNRDRIEKITGRKTIQRSGASRPWQEHITDSRRLYPNSEAPIVEIENDSVTSESNSITQKLQLSIDQLPTTSQSVVDNQSTIEKHCSNVSNLGLEIQINGASQLSTSGRQLVDGALSYDKSITESVVDQSSTSGQQMIYSDANQLPTTSQSAVNHLSLNSRSTAEPVADQLPRVVSIEPTINSPLWAQLGPAQGAALIAIYQHCEFQTFRTTLMTKNYFITACNISDSSVGSTIQKLVSKGFISRLEGKGGVGGFMHFKIDPNIYHKLKKDGADSLTPSVVNRLPDQLSTASSKLVSNYKELTKLNPKSIEDDFLIPADLDLLQVAVFGITRKHIQDIKNQKLNFTTSTLQDFINRFAEYAKDPKNIKNIQSVPAIFCKMAQLASKGEDPLIDIETDVDRLIRERIERLKTKREDRIKQQTELIELEFENWLAEIKTTGQDQLAKPTALMKSGSISQKMTLKNHFIEQVWPEITKVLGL